MCNEFHKLINENNNNNLNKYVLIGNLQYPFLFDFDSNELFKKKVKVFK